MLDRNFPSISLTLRIISESRRYVLVTLNIPSISGTIKSGCSPAWFKKINIYYFNFIKNLWFRFLSIEKPKTGLGFDHPDLEELFRQGHLGFFHFFAIVITGHYLSKWHQLFSLFAKVSRFETECLVDVKTILFK